MNKAYCTLILNGVILEKDLEKLATMLASRSPYQTNHTNSPQKAMLVFKEDPNTQWEFGAVRNGAIHPDLKSLLIELKLDWVWNRGEMTKDYTNRYIFYNTHKGEKATFMYSHETPVLSPEEITPERIAEIQKWKKWEMNASLTIAKSAHEFLEKQ